MLAGQPGAEYNGGARAPRTELGNDCRHRPRGGADDRELRRDGQAFDIRIGQYAGHGPVLRIDRHDGALEPASEEIAHDGGTDAARPVRGADDRHGARSEQIFQVANAHFAFPAGL